MNKSKLSNYINLSIGEYAGHKDTELVIKELKQINKMLWEGVFD